MNSSKYYSNHPMYSKLAVIRALDAVPFNIPVDCEVLPNLTHFHALLFFLAIIIDGLLVTDVYL